MSGGGVSGVGVGVGGGVAPGGNAISLGSPFIPSGGRGSRELMAAGVVGGVGVGVSRVGAGEPEREGAQGGVHVSGLGGEEREGAQGGVHVSGLGGEEREGEHGGLDVSGLGGEEREGPHGKAVKAVIQRVLWVLKEEVESDDVKMTRRCVCLCLCVAGSVRFPCPRSKTRS